MFDDLLEDLEALSKSDVGQARLEELDELCKNPIFRLLCRVCDQIDPLLKEIKK